MIDGWPKYQRNGTVWAVRIQEIVRDPRSTNYHLIPEGGAHLPVKIDMDFMMKFNPKAGGYLVSDQDGNLAYQPAASFETTHSLVRI